MLLLLTLASSLAAPLRVCTDRGGLSGTLSPDGTISALIDGFIVAEGTEDALTLYAKTGDWWRPKGTVLWAGPLADLSPTPLPPLTDLPEDGAWIAGNLAHVGVLAGCPRDGGSGFFVGAWPDLLPLPDGGRVTWASATESLIRTSAGAGWMKALPLRRDQAAGLADALAMQWPDVHTAVAWQDGMALVQVSTDPALLTPGAAPAPAAVDLMPILDVPDVVLRSEPLPSGSDLPVLLAGREQVAALNLRRIEAGLEPVAWSDALGLRALEHCAYIDWQRQDDQTFHGHGQKPGGPLFTGETAGERHKAWEIIHRSRADSPEDAVDGWLTTPYHRVAPMHPDAVEAGACTSPDGTAVMMLHSRRSTPGVTVYPPDGALDVPLSFSGLESPDPLPISAYPDKTLPVGFTVTAWLFDQPATPRLLSSKMTADGQTLPHYTVFDRDDFRRGTGQIHLIPTAPYPPEAEIQWQIKLRVDGDRTSIRGMFTTTAHPDGDPVALEDTVLVDWLAGVNEARASTGLPPMRVTRLSQALADQYAAGRQWSDAITTQAQVSCSRYRSPGEQMTGWAQEPQYDLLGVSQISDGEHCVMLVGDPLTPR